METVIEKAIASGQPTELDCTVQQFSEVEQLLQESRAKFTFNSAASKLWFTMPTNIHAACTNWFAEWCGDLRVAGNINEDDLMHIVEGTIPRFSGRYTNSSKTPDAALYVMDGTTNPHPSIVMEVGYTESYEKLLRDADLLLLGSRGAISAVILVKLFPVEDGEIASGFVETLRHRQSETVRYGSRLDLFPKPLCHRFQKITFDWDQILREDKNSILGSPNPPPPLYLDDLRAKINNGLRIQLRFNHPPNGNA